MLKTESFRKGIAYSVFFNFLARGVAFLNAFVIAFYFGAGSITDLYFYILSFVTIVSGFINGMDTYVLIPEAMRLKHQKSELNSMQFLNFFLYLYLALGIIISVIIVINPVSLFGLISKFDHTQLSDNITILYYSAILVILVLVTNLQTSIFASYRFFTMPMVVSLVNNILSFVMIVLLHKHYGIKSGMLGMIGGYLLNIAFLTLYMKRKLNWNFSFAKSGITPATKRNLFFIQSSNVFPYLRNYISIYLLSGLPAGTVASYNYGQQLSTIPDIVFGQVGVVSAIKLNELHAQKKYEELNNVFLKVTKVLLFILFPVSGIIFLYSYEIVQFLYERGKFDAAAVGEVSRFLKYIALLLPLGVLMSMTAKIFTAFQKVSLTFYYNVFINLFLIGLMALGVYLYGVMGYLLSFIAGYFIVIFVLYYLLKYAIAEIRYIESLIFFFKLLAINGAITFMVWWLKGSFLNEKVHFLINGIIGGIIYLLFLYVFARIFKLKVFFKKATYFD